MPPKGPEPTRFSIQLLDPIENPCLGMESYPDPITIGRGKWKQLTNTRRTKRSVRVRDGIAKLTSATPGGGTAVFRGADIVNVDGTAVWVAAYLISAAVRIYRLDPSTYSWSSGVGTELTAASGKYGSTRLSDAWVEFAVTYDAAAGKSYIVATNGTDSPLWIDITAASGARVAAHASITFPTDNPMQGVLARFADFVQISGASPPTYTVSTAAEFNIADTGTSPNNYALVSIDSTISGSEWIKIDTGAQNLEIDAGKHLAVHWESSFRNFWDNVRIEFSHDDATYVEAWDGSDSPNRYEKRVVSNDPEGKKIWTAFDISHLAVGANVMRYIRITWVGNAPSVDVTLNLYNVVITGSNPGLSLYEGTYFNSGSRGESKPFLADQATTARVKEMGGPVLNDMRIPFDLKLYYVYDVTFINITQAMANVGVDGVRLYRRDALGNDQQGNIIYESRAYLETTSTRASYAAGWTVTGTVAGKVSETGLGVWRSGRNPTVWAPGDSHLCMPKCATVASIGKRLVIGNVNTGSARSADVWVSEDGNGGRFATRVSYINDDLSLPDPDSPTRHTFDGETVLRVFRLNGPVAGPQSFLVATNLRMWMIGGVTSIEPSRAIPLAAVGLASARAICQSKYAVYFFSNEQEMCRLVGADVKPLSFRTFEDKLSAATLTRASLWSFKNMVYGSYVASGGTTYIQALVWDEIEESVNEDTPASTSEFGQFVSYGTQLIYFGTDGHVWQHEKAGQTTDNGTNVSVVMTSSRVRPDPFKQFNVQRLGAFVSDAASGTLACSVTYHPGTGSAQTFSTSVDVTPDYAWKLTSQTTAGNDGRGNSADFAFTATLPGGTEITHLWADCEPRTGRG